MDLIKSVLGRRRCKEKTNNVNAIFVIFVTNKKQLYVQPLFTSTITVDSYFNLPKEMLLGGDYLNFNILLKYPMVLQMGDRFTSNLVF